MMPQNRSAVADRNLDALIGGSIFLAIIVGMIAPRTLGFTPFFVSGAIIVAALFLVGNTLRGTGQSVCLPCLSFFAFCLFVAVSALWSVAPKAAIQKALVLAVMGEMAIVSALLLNRINISQRLVRVILSALFIAIIACTIDVMSGMAVRHWIVNAAGLKPPLIPATFYILKDDKIVLVVPAIANRWLVSLAIIIWPAILLALTRRRGIMLASILYLLTALSIFASESETAKLQLVASTAIFLSCLRNTVWAARLVFVGWVVACALVVPIMSLMYASHFGGSAAVKVVNNYVRASPQARIMIAQRYVERIGEAPIFGHGAGSSRAISQGTQGGDGSGASMAQHPHNCYLQLWFELGGVGAGLFMVIGLLVISAIGSFPSEARSIAYAQFVSLACLLAPSYGFWQPWQSGMICFTVILAALALQASRMRQASERAA